MKNIASQGLDGSPGEYLPVENVIARWGKASTAGFAAVPNALIHSQGELKLTSNDMVVVLNLLSHWWYGKRTPFPSSALIAKRSGLGVRTVQRCLKHLQREGLIKPVLRPEGGTRYEMDGLVEAVSEKAMAHEWRRGGTEERLKDLEIGWIDQRL